MLGQIPVTMIDTMVRTLTPMVEKGIIREEELPTAVSTMRKEAAGQALTPEEQKAAVKIEAEKPKFPVWLIPAGVIAAKVLL